MKTLQDERGSYAVPILYIVIFLLGLQLTAYMAARYWVQVVQEDIQAKLDASNMACYPNLNLESLADTAFVALEMTEARTTFETVLAKQLELDEQTLTPKPSSPIQQLQIEKFKIYRPAEVPATLPDGRKILHAPAIESQITVHVRLPFLNRTFPFKFRSVTDLPQTP